jgi:hypothetical protein
MTMKKRLSLAVVFCGLLGLLVGGTAFALPGPGWFTGVQIQNIGTGPATISVSYYARDTADVYTYTPSTPVAQNSSINILGSEGTGWSPSQPPAGFIGSAVVESDQAVLAIVNETNGTAAGQYKGASGGTETTISVPLVKYSLGGKSSEVTVQNIGTASTTVTVNYSGKIGATPATGTDTHTIDANKMWVFSPAGIVGAGFLGAATVSSSGGVPITAVSNEFFSDAANANYGRVLQASNAFGSVAGTTTLYVPIQKKNFPAVNGKSTGLQVQNLGAAAADISVTWRDQNTALTYTGTYNGLAAGESYTFYGASMTTPAGFVGSAVVTATQNIVAIVNESFDAPPAGGQKSTTYAGFNNNLPTTKVYVPLQKKNLGVNTTGIQIMNVSASSASVTCTYYVGGSTYPVSKTVNANASQTWLNEPAVPNASYGSAICESTANIIGVINEASTTMDVKNYEGFNG